MLLHRPGWEAVGAATLVWEASLPPREVGLLLPHFPQMRKLRLREVERVLPFVSEQRSVGRMHVQPEQLTPEAQCPHLPSLGGRKSPSLNCVPSLFTPHDMLPGKRMSFGCAIFFSYHDHFMFLLVALCVCLRHFTLSLLLFSSWDLKSQIYYCVLWNSSEILT